MKIAAGIIVFNSDFVLRQVLESIYPHVSQILISEGCVGYWVAKGYTTSTDRTNDIIHSFPDPEKKITIVHGTYPEKTEQANAYMQHLHPDTDFLWNVDADEVFKQHDIITIKDLLRTGRYNTVGFQSLSFYGGFGHHLTGFEENVSFIRIRKAYPGCTWDNHRPPTIKNPSGVAEPERLLSHTTLAEMGIRMYHYSYVYPRQVYEKINYYENAVINKGDCIPNYFQNVYMAWVRGNTEQKQAIEAQYKGVHEFAPHYRGDCFTAPFTGQHPDIIQRDLPQLIAQYKRQLEEYKDK